jgi:hypothetical protein
MICNMKHAKYSWNIANVGVKHQSINQLINHEFTYPRFLLKAPNLESTNLIDFRVFLILIYILLFSDLDLLLDILLWQDSTPIMCYQGVGLPVQQELFPIHQNRMGKLDYRY